MIIYRITNKTNGKVYIGQTNKSLEERKRTHRNRCFGKYYNKTKLYDAIRVYGWDNFEWAEIDTANSQEELDQKEIDYIRSYNSIDNGYNMITGGLGFNPMDSEYIKTKHLAIVQSEEFRTKISKSITYERYTKERNSKISNKMQGNINGMCFANAIRGTNIKSGEIKIYPSRAHAARDLRPDKENSAKVGIFNALTGKRPSALGYKWEYVKDTECVETIENINTEC